MPANVESMFSVRQMPWHREGTSSTTTPAPGPKPASSPGWTGTRSPPRSTPSPASTGDGTPHYEPIEGWKAICRSDTGAVLSVNRDTYTVIGHGEMGEIVEAVLAQPNVQWETAGVLDGGRAVWCLALLDEPVELPGDDSARRCRTWRSPTGTTAPPPAPCAPPRSGSCAPTPSAPPNSKASGPAPPSPSSTNPAGGPGSRKPARPSPAPAPRSAATPNSPTNCWRSRSRRGSGSCSSPSSSPCHPHGLVTDRVARNVEEARQALRLIFESKTTEQVAGTAYGLMQAAGRIPRPRPHRPVLGDPAQPDPDPARAAQAPGPVADPRSRRSGMNHAGCPWERHARGHPAPPLTARKETQS